jgi:hypothetical protein
MKRRVKVVLNGGLGNQLFQYFAGLHLAKSTDSQLYVDSTFSQRGRTGHSDWIDVLGLPGVISRDAPPLSISYLLGIIRKTIRGVSARLVSQSDLRERLFRQYRSAQVGYDPKVEHLQPPVTLIGYFQTWRHYQWLKDNDEIPNFQISHPTNWFLEMEKRLESNAQVLGLHLRRGDYLNNPAMGVLASEYYRTAIKQLKQRGLDWDAVWVFSDDCQRAEVDLKGIFSETEEVVYISPPEDSHSFESLYLMSKTKILVTANSTFSWWAATLGDADRPVVCPETWFSNMDEPIDLVPDHWIRASSTWIKD